MIRRYTIIFQVILRQDVKNCSIRRMMSGWQLNSANDGKIVFDEYGLKIKLCEQRAGGEQQVGTRGL